MDRDAIKAVGYVRVSTDSQVRHGYSVGRAEGGD